MKKLLHLMFMMSSCCILSNSAKAMQYIPDDGVDGHFLTVLTDSTFNSMQNALYVGPDNELLVGNLGVDMYAVAETKNGMQIIYPGLNRTSPLVIKEINLRHDSIVIPVKSTDAIDFQGHRYSMIVRVNHSKLTQYVPLSHIADEFCLGTVKSVPCIYMINERVILDDPDAYKVDKNFILKVELVSSKEIHSLSSSPALQIVRIYTKTHRNNEIDSSVILK